MKKIIFLILLFPIISSAQIQVELPSDYVRNSKLDSSISKVKYKGSPYLDEKFTEGELIIDNQKKYSVKLRYNAYSDVFEMLNEKQEKMAVLKSSNVSILVGPKKYKLLNFKNTPTYFEVLSVDGKVKLFKKESKKFIESQKAQSGYSSDKPAKFVLETSYYINTSNNLHKIKLNKKAILIELNDKKNELNDYIKKNKLKLKKEVEIINLIEYYNSL